MPELIFSADGSGRLSLPDRCTVNVECLERPEIQQAVMQVLEESLYVAAFAGIDLKALDGITVATDCRAAACALQNLPAGQVALEMKEQPDALELARTAAVRRNGDLRFHIVVRPVYSCWLCQPTKRCNGLPKRALHTRRHMSTTRVISLACFQRVMANRWSAVTVRGKLT